MDEQDPRVTERRAAGRRTNETMGYATAGQERRSAAAPTRRAVVEPPEAEQRTREIRSEIEQTREELSETVTAIQDRLRPSTVASTAMDSIKTAATESEPARYVGANPIPSAMVGIGMIGLAWLAFRGREARTYRFDGYTARYEPTAAPEAWTYEEPPVRSRQVARRAQNHLTRTWNETPLLVGAAAMVAGAIVGLSIPETEREHQLMGETRDRLIETAQRTVKDKVAQVQEVAKDVTGLTDDRA
jgi:hypothetical protein